jgi:tetratricopeptide (TPR) repeat protein
MSWLAGVVAIGMWSSPAAVWAKCKLARIAELPVTMVDMHPMVTAKINGTDARFIADSGAFFSMMTPAGAAEFALRTYPGPWGLRVVGMGGEAGQVSVTTVKVFTLAGVPIHDVEFVVAGGDVGGGGVGLLGQNVFSIGDVEYDLSGGVIRLMHEDDCGKANLAYWAPGQPYSMIEIERTTPQAPHTAGIAEVNGIKVRVMFDTGAATSVLSERAAQKAGIKVDAPGVIEAGYSRGVGRGMVRTWIAPFSSFKLGDEEIRNTKLRIGDTLVEGADMLIGADFFLSHRVYVASSQHRLFFTYNGGPVFNLAVARTPSPAPVSPSSPAQTGAAPDASASAVSSDQPKDAADYSRRGTARAARREFRQAIADLTRACELEPNNPEYFYERGVAEVANEQRDPARADFDQAIELKPDHVPALVARADLEVASDQKSEAAADLDAADRAAAKEADARFQMAFEYAHADRLSRSVEQISLWISAHRDDARLADALNERCWVRALSGQDLRPALDDCNAALKRIAKLTMATSRVLESRGLVRLRLGEFEKSVADFDGALSTRPQDPWALYGRGIDKRRLGRTGEGDADLAAAVSSWSPIAEEYGRFGVLP